MNIEILHYKLHLEFVKENFHVDLKLVKSRKKSDWRITINGNDYVITNNEKYEGLLMLESDNGLLGYGDVECLVKTMIARYECIFDEHMARTAKMKPDVGMRYLFGKLNDTDMMNFILYQVVKTTNIPRKFFSVERHVISGGFRVMSKMNDVLSLTFKNSGSDPITLSGAESRIVATSINHVLTVRCHAFKSTLDEYIRIHRDEAQAICAYINEGYSFSDHDWLD